MRPTPATNGRENRATIPDTINHAATMGRALTALPRALRRASTTPMPHTTGATILDEYAVNRAVNLEVDLIARYLERLLTGA